MPENNDGEVRILGSLRSLDGAGVIRFEDRLEAKIDDVWLALTDPVRLGGWLGEIEGEFRPGGQFRARYFASGWEGTGRVEQCEPRQRLLISTESADAEARIIEVTLTAVEGRTDLVIEVRAYRWSR
ncbi:MAG: SRPBCC domain-containing protein [Tepidiformaceae bacterium]